MEEFRPNPANRRATRRLDKSERPVYGAASFNRNNVLTMKIGVTLLLIAFGAAGAATAASACGFHHAPVSVQSQATPSQPPAAPVVSQKTDSQMTTTATTTTGKTTGS